MLENNSKIEELYSFISKKAFELSYALCRISQSIKNESFAKTFEEQGIKILDSATAKDINGIKQSILSIEYFMHLANSLNLIRQNLTETIIAELNNLNIVINEYENDLILPEIDINHIFEAKFESKIDSTIKKQKSKKENNSAKRINKKEKDSAILGTIQGSATNSAMPDLAIQGSAMNDWAIYSAKENFNSAKDNFEIKDLAMNNSAIDSSAIEKLKYKSSAIDLEEDSAMLDSAMRDSAIEDSAINNPAIDSAMSSAIEIPNIELENENKESGFEHISEIIKQEKGESIKNEDLSIRKSVFLDKIRYFDEFRIRDLEEIFPELSERTIRYYLSDLINQGLVEKIGSSGPNVVYRTRK
jgi:hypothetical protein